MGVYMTIQEQAQRWLDIIYDENQDIKINPIYLNGNTQAEVFESFSHFRNYMISLFEGMARGETQFSSALHCIFAMLSAIVNSSELKDNTLVVDKVILKEKLKMAKKADKEAVIELLENNGFVFDENIFKGKEQYCVIEYPDDNLVLKGLYLYSITQDYEINSSMMFWNYLQHMYILMNPRLFENTKENNIEFILDDMLRFLDSEEEKNAIKYFHSDMLENGYIFMFTVAIFGYGPEDATIRYEYKRYDPRAVVRVHFGNYKAGIGIRIRELRKYNEYIDNCSDDFKNTLNNLWIDCDIEHCQHDYKEPCKQRLEYRIGDEKYCKCTFEWWKYIWDKSVFVADMKDIDTYLYFVKENDIKKKKKGL